MEMRLAAGKWNIVCDIPAATEVWPMKWATRVACPRSGSNAGNLCWGRIVALRNSVEGHSLLVSHSPKSQYGLQKSQNHD